MASSALPDPTSNAGAVTELLARSAQGDAEAFDALFSLLYDELRKLARRHVRDLDAEGQTLSTTALVHESYLKLAGGSRPPLKDRGQFFLVASKAMRHILVDYARHRRAQRRGGGYVRISLSPDIAARQDPVAEVLELDMALRRLGEKDARLEQVVECRFFAGMNVADTASALGVSGRTVERDWQRARLYLHRLLSQTA